MSDIGDLGRFGETTFKSWCAVAGLVVNGSLEHDTTGWDCKVEYKHLHQTAQYNPLQPENSLSHPIFDFQIKTTQSTKESNKWQIRLDHLIRFAQSPTPAILCILNVNLSEGKVNHICMIHIDERHIAKILKKHRALIKDNKSIENKLMTITAEQGDVIYKDFHHEIKNRLDSIIANGMQAYSNHKNNILDKIGYEQHQNTLKFNASPELFNNHVLGLKQNINVSDIVIIDNRFGIPMEQQIKDVVLEMPGDEIPATLIVQNNTDIKFMLSVQIRKTIFDITNTPSLAYATILHEAFKIVFYKDSIKFFPSEDLNGEILIEHIQTYTKLRIALCQKCFLTVFFGSKTLAVPIDYTLNYKLIENYHMWNGSLWAMEKIKEMNRSLKTIKLEEMQKHWGIFTVLSLLQEKTKEESVISYSVYEKKDLPVSKIKNGVLYLGVVVCLNEKEYCFIYAVEIKEVTVKNKKVTTRLNLSNSENLQSINVDDISTSNFVEYINMNKQKPEFKKYEKQESMVLTIDHMSFKS